MPYRVVKPFAYGADGIHAVELVSGDVREDFGDSTAGLLAEKYIVAVDAVSIASAADEAVETVSEVAAIEVAPENRIEVAPRRRRK